MTSESRDFVTRDVAPRSTPPGEHLHNVLAREFWRCTGLAENAKQEAQNSDATTRAFQEEYDKWQARANEILAVLGDVPENPLPGSIE